MATRKLEDILEEKHAKILWHLYASREQVEKYEILGKYKDMTREEVNGALTTFRHHGIINGGITSTNYELDPSIKKAISNSMANKKPPADKLAAICYDLMRKYQNNNEL